MTKPLRKLTDKEKVLKGGWIVAIGVITIYLATVISFMLNGITGLYIEMPILMLLVIVHPILSFFLGVYIVMKKKIFPLKKGEVKDGINDQQ